MAVVKYTIITHDLWLLVIWNRLRLIVNWCHNVVVIRSCNNLGRLCLVEVRFYYFRCERRLKMPNQKRRVRLRFCYLQVKIKRSRMLSSVGQTDDNECNMPLQEVSNGDDVHVLKCPLFCFISLLCFLLLSLVHPENELLLSPSMLLMGRRHHGCCFQYC
jgi:hypothetical protein